MKIKIIAIIPTYNRKKELEELLKTITNVNEIKKIIIVNNNSNDETKFFLKKIEKENKNIISLSLKKNIGGAGAFYYGIKYAFKTFYEDFDFLYLIDDDCLINKKTVNSLLNSFLKLNTFSKIGFVSSAVYWVNNEICEMNQPNTTWDFLKFYNKIKNFHPIKIESNSFVSILIPKYVFLDVGLPIKDFFIWYDDVEFTKRISKKYECFLIPESKVIHKIKENKGVNFSLINEKNINKYMFGARNEAYWIYKNKGIFSLLDYIKHRNKEMKIGKIKLIFKLKIFLKIIEGAFFFKPKIEKIKEY